MADDTTSRSSDSRDADTDAGRPADGDADTDAGRPTDGDADTDAGRPTDGDADTDAGRPADEDTGREDTTGRPPEDEPTGNSPGNSDVVVPLRLYKTVTVFSTLIAIVSILAGFVLLDRGTQRATASPEEVSLPVVALGLGLIVGGSAVYAFSTRFRAEGMGKPKDDTDEPTDNG